jgi:hypothetical protein
MADEQQHFEEQEQYEGDGMDTVEGHEETADVRHQRGISAFVTGCR